MLVADNDNKGITYHYNFKVKKLYGSCDVTNDKLYIYRTRIETLHFHALIKLLNK